MVSPAEVAKLADAPDSKSGGASPRAGSTPAFGIDTLLGLLRSRESDDAPHAKLGQGDDTHSRRPDGRGRLPRPERGHPCRRPAVASTGGTGRRRPRGLARARSRGSRRSSGRARSPASCRAAGRSSAPRARTRTRSTAASSACSRTSTGSGLDALVAVGGEDTLGRRVPPPRRARRRGGRRPEDDRQRPLGDGLHVRLRHRRLRSRPRRSTGCTRRPSRTTASWSSR